jgi:hypothetical protein
VAEEIFKAFPESVTGLVFHQLDCGCIYCWRQFPAGEADRNFGIYRDAEDGSCEICMIIDEDWKDRVPMKSWFITAKFRLAKNYKVLGFRKAKFMTWRPK